MEAETKTVEVLMNILPILLVVVVVLFIFKAFVSRDKSGEEDTGSQEEIEDSGDMVSDQATDKAVEEIRQMQKAKRSHVIYKG